MKITRMAEIYINVDGNRALRVDEELTFHITGEEAVQSILGDVEGQNADGYHLKMLLNNFANFIRHIEDGTIQKLSPEARKMICGFLAAQIKRFE